ncbi:tetratricopeptide repeat protein [Butyricimonas virosa]|uniref:tetratricopeptide repeat protein n=1 Tax=Butyricimonas virosa TaxID=544645 RepID=UPI002432B864|nr:hypothetical protein [Butyricimonas virosa]
MSKVNLQLLLKMVSILIILFAAIETKSQVTSKFRAMTFDERAKPLQMATEAYKVAEKDFEEYYTKAVTELATNKPNYKLALFYYDKCIELNSRFNGTLFNWGKLLHQKGVCLNYTKDYIEANKCFAAAAQWHTRRKEYSNAIANYDLYLSNQYDCTIMFYRARCWDIIGNEQMSIKDYNTIINKGCSNKTILAMSYNNKAHNLIKAQKYTEALPLVNKALEFSGAISFIWDTRGELYYHLGEYEKCIQDMDRAISITDGETSYDNSYYYRGLAKLKLQRKAEARKDLKKAFKYGKIEAQKYL